MCVVCVILCCVLLLYYCHRAKTQLQFNKYILTYQKKIASVQANRDGASAQCGNIFFIEILGNPELYYN
jgi:hypothetical protein